MRGRPLLLIAIGASILIATPSAVLPATAIPATAAPAARSHVRLDQLGYLSDETKHARLMTSRAIGDAHFRVLDAGGDTVLRGDATRHRVGSWNGRYRAVYDLPFTRVTQPGRYRIVVRGDVTTRSPSFRVLGAKALYGKLLRFGVNFDQTQRDGADVIPGALRRKPAHLHDRRARVYAWPNFVPGSDTITDRDLHRIGGPVDAAGGWYDAGDYLKFTHSSAYNDVLLFSSARMLGKRAPRMVEAEARHGLAWLGKMWDARDRALYIQVGIGSSNQAGTFHGDHDKWRLPQADDHDRGRLDRYVSHRPVFAAAEPGDLISPNLVGRVSAAFALAAQLDAADHHARAVRELRQATLLYARADTASPPRPLVTALPHAFYPESSWHDDMELGATEIALAARKLHRDARPYIHDAAHWAAGYLRTEAGDILNLYDTSALAHADLVGLLRRGGGHSSHLAVGARRLVGDLRRQLHGAAVKASRDPFSAGATYDNFDANSHTFGLVATAALYHRLVGANRFDTFATSQRNWLLGGNPWGVSAMVGVGTTFPHCMQHQLANLSGTTDGTPPLDVGAVVNGPNAASIFADGLGGFQSAMVRCPSDRGDPFAKFNGRHSRYVDDVRSWQTNEPALDMTGAAIIAAASQLAIRR